MQYRHFPVPANSGLHHSTVTLQYLSIPPLVSAVLVNSIPSFSSTCHFHRFILYRQFPVPNIPVPALSVNPLQTQFYLDRIEHLKTDNTVKWWKDLKQLCRLNT
jgi:hypothetical protein